MPLSRRLATSPSDYRQQAEKYADLAQAVRNKAERKILANIAGQLRRLANHKEKTRESGPAPVVKGE